MEEYQELKHVCKFCKKTYPCGRSLGGHMRSHMSNTSTEIVKKLSKKKLSSSVNGESNNNNTHMVGFEAGGHAGYGLRENPKKTWRFSDSINGGTLPQGKVCRECGKGFQSWKALFGHMRCHSESERERVFHSLEDDSWTDEEQKPVMDSQSDNEAVAPNRKRRSRRTRYNTTNATSTSLSFANASSSSVSEIEQEQEEVAICLMMLSRDERCWGGLNSVAESSDNNSEVFGTVKMKKPRGKKLELCVLNSGDVRFERKKTEFGGSGSGFWRNGVKKVKSEVSVDGFIGDDESKKHKLDDETELKVSYYELGKNFNAKNNVKTAAVLGKDFIEEAGDQDDLEFGNYNSSKRTRYDAYKAEMGEDSCKKAKSDASDSLRKSKYKCTTCNKIFHSYQALGGHRASHKKVKGCFASRIERSENTIETDVSPDPTDDDKLIRSCNKENPVDLEGLGCAETSYGSKNNKHECPICLKVFTSGQALGGHKRSHLVGGSEARGNQTIVIQKQLSEIHDLLDLNLPAPSEECTNGNKPWWVGSNHRHEQLVGLISN